MKTFFVDPAQVKPVATGFGACYATDEVAVKGRKVGFMYREEADGERDSGWRFMAGDEDQDYMDNPDNLGVYDINLIANIDPSVVAHLASRIGTGYERDEASGQWERSDSISATSRMATA
jgi:hypothetical protein